MKYTIRFFFFLFLVFALRPAFAQDFPGISVSSETENVLNPRSDISLAQFNADAAGGTGNAGANQATSDADSTAKSVAENEASTSYAIKAPMENVFHNTLWGGLSGGLVTFGWAALFTSNSNDKSSLRFLASSFADGATVGALVGCFVGIFLSLNGTEFNQRAIAYNINDAILPDRPKLAAVPEKAYVSVFAYSFKF